MKELFFRVDFGKKIGWGHLIRCSALAAAAKERSIKTVLITQGDITSLPEEAADSFDQKIFTDQLFPTFEYVQEGQGLIIDHYAYDNKQFEEIKKNQNNFKIIQINDFYKKISSLVDLSILPGFVGEAKDLPKNCIGGLKYTLIRSAFKPISIRKRTTYNRVLIFLGGTDAIGILEETTQYLHEETKGDIDLMIISPEENLEKNLPHFKSLSVRSKLSSNEIANAYQTCDASITTCGTTTYEMAACKLPLIGICVANNQEETATLIHTNWNIPIIRKLNKNTFTKAWEELSEKNIEFSSQLDTEGSRRVIDAICNL